MPEVTKQTKNDVYITPACILSYPALFEPKCPPGSTVAKYSCALVFLADTPPDVRKRLEDMIDAAGLEKFGPAYAQLKKLGKLTLPIHDEDIEPKGYPKGSFYFNCSTKTQPGIVGPYPGPDNKPVAITNPDLMYPGAIVRASLNTFAYDTAGNKGVSFGLRNIQKLRDGSRLDNRKRAEDEFDAVAEAAFDDALL